MKQFYTVTQMVENPRWWVVRGAEIIARSYKHEDAAKVAAALNRLESDIHKGE